MGIKKSHKFSEKLEWSVTSNLLVVGGEFEESAFNGKRLVVLLNAFAGRLIQLRFTEDNFRYLLREMKPGNHHREEFTDADGKELFRWIKHKFLKVRVQKFTPTGRITAELVELVKDK